jgi:Legionella pneumophila major outer membrane protein precursor
VLALGLAMAIAAGAQQASAQRLAKNSYQARGSNPSARSNHVSSPPNAYGEHLPAQHSGGHAGPALNHSDPFVEGETPPAGFPEAAYYGDGHCTDDVVYGGYPYGAGHDWFGTNTPSQFFFTAEYLYVRASFSEAVAFLERDISQPNLAALDYTQLDFDYESSFRLGGGWRQCGCGTECRFIYTRFNSSGSDIAPPGALVPVEPNQPVDRTLVDADVDMNSYDLECAKTIPLCSQPCCDCSDPCGGDCCAPRCPTWDITWSGGLRVAEGGWEHAHTSLNTAGMQVADNVTTMDFEGIGLKTGLEGRRYFFSSGWLSTYLKGDISLLMGQLEFETTHTTVPPTGPDFVTTVSNDSRQIIPVTEIEAGLTGQLTNHTRVSAGYLLSAWHDLGFRDEFPATGLDPVFPIRYDDANILGFDGFFARVEVAY